jgi:hypothetical protein
MNDREAWKIIGANIPEFTSMMLGLQKGSWIDVFCDSAGKNFSFSQSTVESNIKLCSMTAADLERYYDIHRKGDQFFNGDGEEIPKDQLADYLAQYIIAAKNDGSEWGWEFRV